MQFLKDLCNLYFRDRENIKTQALHPLHSKGFRSRLHLVARTLYLGYLEQKAQALGFDLVPHSSPSECVS